MKLNEVYHLIIYCLNCIRREQNTTYKTDLIGVKKLNYISQFYLFVTKYKTATYNEKNEHYFLTLITAG
jgi:hypothetical protein